MNILGVTLARGGSKSIPRKNIRPLCEKPLIWYTIKEAQKSELLTHYVVSTDDAEIAEVAENFSVEVPFMRPPELATDKATSVDAIEHCVNFMESANNMEFDIIVELMATNPLKTVEDIDACISRLIENDADSVIAMNRIYDHHPARIKKIINGKIVDFCVDEPNEMRRQDLDPPAYVRSGSIYVMKRDYLMEKGRRYGGDNSIAYILPEERVANLDEMSDWNALEAKLAL